MALDRADVLKAIRERHPEFQGTADDDLVRAMSEELGEPNQARVIQAIGEELGVPERQTFGKGVTKFLASIPAEIAKDIAAPVRLPIDLVKSLQASGRLDDLPPVDYTTLRSQGVGHEEAKAQVQAYADELNRRAQELQSSAASGQEQATRVAASAAGTLAGGGLGGLAGGLAGRSALPAAAARIVPQLVGGAATGGAYGGVSALGQGKSLGEAAQEAGIGAAAGGILGPAAPPVARFIGRELGGPLAKVGGKFIPALARRQAAEAAISANARVNPAVARLMKALEEAAPVRAEQEALYAAERGRRFGRFRQIGEQVSGEEGARAQMRTLKGALPRADFESLKGKIAQEDVNELFNIVRRNPVLSETEQARTYEALWKLLGEAGGVVPQANEIELLNAVYGPQFTEALLRKQPLFTQALRHGIELVNVPRALLSSYDLSAPFRQGAFLIGRPKQFFPAFVAMFKALPNQRVLDELNENIATRANAARYRAGRLSLTEIGGLLGKREEAFIGNMAERIPVLGAGVRASQRAYVAFLNKLRADVFDDIVKNAERAGRDVDDPRFLRSLGDFINSATGRGTLPGGFKLGAGRNARRVFNLERNAAELSTVLFSPRLIASRLNLLNPYYYWKLDPFVRVEALKTAMGTAAVATAVLGLAKLGGARIEADPRSTDFGKVRIGNTRYDLFAGFQQYVRFGAQLLPNFGTPLPFGAVKSAATGQLREYGKGFHPVTRKKQIAEFLENKLAPVPGFLWTLAEGRHRFPETPILETLKGVTEGRNVPRPGKATRNITLRREIEDLVTPLALRDALDAMEEWGVETGSIMGIPAILGTGIQSFPSPPAQPSPVPGSILERVLQERTP